MTFKNLWSEEELKSLSMRVKGMKNLTWNSIFKKLRLWHPVPSLHGKQKGKKVETVTDFTFLTSKITVVGDCIHEIKKILTLCKESHDKPREHIKKLRHHFANKGHYSQSYGFSSSHVWMWIGPWRRLSAEELMFWIVVLEKTLESPLDHKEIKPVNSQRNQSWIFTGST